MKERILQLALALGISPRAFGISIGMSKSWTSTMSNNGIGSNVMAKILTTYPNVNPDWLILGKGEIFRLEAIDCSDPQGVERYYRELYAVVCKDNESLRRDNAKLRDDLYRQIERLNKLSSENISLKEQLSKNK